MLQQSARSIDPSHIDDYAYAAAQIAARYPQAYAIELFFEPNNANLWGGPPDPKVFSTRSAKRRTQSTRYLETP